MAEGRQEVSNDDEYNKATDLVMQEEVTAESDKFQSMGYPKGSVYVITVINVLTKEKAKVWACCIKFDMLSEKRSYYCHGLWEQTKHSRQSWVGK